MRCDFGTTTRDEEDISLEGQVVPRKDTFRYLGSMLQRDGDIDEDVSYRIKAGWMKWRQASDVLCDKRVPQKLKGKFYRTAIRPAMLYGAECWPTKRRHVQQLSVAEMRMFWICGHTRRDRVRNDDIRDRLGVAPIEEKLVQHRLSCTAARIPGAGEPATCAGRPSGHQGRRSSRRVARRESSYLYLIWFSPTIKENLLHL